MKINPENSEGKGYAVLGVKMSCVWFLVGALSLLMTGFSSPLSTRKNFRTNLGYISQKTGHREVRGISYDGTFGLSVGEELFGQVDIEDLNGQGPTGEESRQEEHLNADEAATETGFDLGILGDRNFDISTAVESGLVKPVGSFDDSTADGRTGDLRSSSSFAESALESGYDLGILGDRNFDITTAVESGIVKPIGSFNNRNTKGGMIEFESGVSFAESDSESGWDLGLLGDSNFDINSAIQDGLLRRFG